MAREWWQFSNWPDGTSGTSPGVTGQDPNAVEPWPAGTNPKACTVFRKEFLNQFVAWKYYLEKRNPPNEQTGWVPAYNTPIIHNGNPWSYWQWLQDPYFWMDLATLDIEGDVNRSKMSTLPGGVEFSANTEFSASSSTDATGTTRWHLPVASALPNHRAFHYANINHSQIKDLQFNVREILRVIREHYDATGVHTEGWHMPIGGVRWRERGSSGRWHDPSDSNYRSYPFPNYGRGQYWTEYVRAQWPYPASVGPNDDLLSVGDLHAGAHTLLWYHSDDPSSYITLVRGRIDFITGIDVYLLTDTNYRYAIYSTGNPSDSQVGGYFVPQNGGYCHAVFELPTSINLDNPPSRIIRVTGLGNGNYQAVQTTNEINLSRGVGIASFPYDRLPDEYKGPDWPTVEGQPHLPNDRHNSWLDNNPQGS